MLTVNDDAPALTRQERVVNGSPSRVFALLAQVEDWPRWQPSVSRASWTSGSRAEVGATFSWTSGGMRIRSVIEDCEPGRVISWRGRTLGTRATHVWRLEEVDGGTRVTTEESMEGWLPRLASRPVTRMLDRAVSETLDALADAVRRDEEEPGPDRR